MEKPSSRHPLVWLVAAITLGLAVALGAAGFDLYFKTTTLEQGDPAVNAIQIENAKHLRELYGNYSRFEFNHPGPAFFYVYALGEWILYEGLGVVPSPHNAHLIAGMLVQSLFLAIALALLARALRWQAWLPLTLLAATFHFSLIYGAFVSIWPPHVLLMPFICFLVAATLVASGRIRFLPLLVVVGGVLFHGHVAQTLFVGALGGLALALAWHHLRLDAERPAWRDLVRSHRRTLLIAGACAVPFLVPIVIDLLTRGLESNVATIVRRFLVNTGDSKSFLQGLLYVASFATYETTQETVLAGVGAETARFFASHAAPVAAWLLILVLPPCIGHALRGRLDAERLRFLRTGHVLLVAALALCVLWAVAQAGPMYYFNGYFYHGVQFFALALALGFVAWLLEGRLPAPVNAAMCVVAAVALTWSARPSRMDPATSGEIIRQGVVTALGDLPPGKPVLLSFEHHVWPEAASVALELKRRQFPFHTVPTWNFMFGERHDISHLGPNPEDEARVWWVAEQGEGGYPITSNLAIFDRPPTVNPLGTVWHFGRAAGGFRHVVRGLSVGNVDVAWTDRREVVFSLVAAPSETDVTVVFEAEANNSGKDLPTVQTAVVSFGGQPLGQVSVSHRAEMSLRIPRDLWNASEGPVELVLQFPHSVEVRSFSRPRIREWYGWALWSIRFEPAPLLTIARK
jgi:hypothetical protein